MEAVDDELALVLMGILCGYLSTYNVDVYPPLPAALRLSCVSYPKHIGAQTTFNIFYPTGTSIGHPLAAIGDFPAIPGHNRALSLILQTTCDNIGSK